MPHYDDQGYSARQRRKDAAADAYTLAFAAVEDELIREFREEGGFGDYLPDGAKVHRIVEQRMAMREAA